MELVKITTRIPKWLKRSLIAQAKKEKSLQDLIIKKLSASSDK
jgi:predicted HicB family RNase H-like nuclease